MSSEWKSIFEVNTYVIKFIAKWFGDFTSQIKQTNLTWDLQHNLTPPDPDNN